MTNKVKVLFVGETWFVFKMHMKGFDMFPLAGYEDYGVWFVEAMSEFKDIEMLHMPNHVAQTSFPKTLEEINQYDVIIISDCGKNTLQLYPDVSKIPMGPDRLDVIKEFVEMGKSFIMAGGWGSYQGFRGGIAGYQGTVIEEILPVKIQSCDDRVEKPQGIHPEILKINHPIFKNLPEEWPLFVGYNKVLPKKETDLLAEINGDPFIAVRNYKKGKTMAFTSDLSKHWGTAFVSWESYKDFWHNTLLWIAG